jgi:hypothetical protein
LQDCLCQWHFRLWQVSNGISDISFKYGLLQNQNCINLSNPSGYAMHHQFNIQQMYALPTLHLCVCVYLRTNSDVCHLHIKLIGCYNRDGKCLLHVTDCQKFKLAPKKLLLLGSFYTLDEYLGWNSVSDLGTLISF